MLARRGSVGNGSRGTLEAVEATGWSWDDLDDVGGKSVIFTASLSFNDFSAGFLSFSKQIFYKV